MLERRAIHAYTLVAAGEEERAQRLFDDAEARQAKLSPREPRLYSAGGGYLCDQLLSERRFMEVAERSTYALAISKLHQWVFDIGQDHWNLGSGPIKLA